MPIRDLLCRECQMEWEELVREGERPTCTKCDSLDIEVLPALVGGYQMSSGGSSTRPKRAGSFRRKPHA